MECCKNRERDLNKNTRTLTDCRNIKIALKNKNSQNDQQMSCPAVGSKRKKS